MTEAKLEIFLYWFAYLQGKRYLPPAMTVMSLTPLHQRGPDLSLHHETSLVFRLYSKRGKNYLQHVLPGVYN